MTAWGWWPILAARQLLPRVTLAAVAFCLVSQWLSNEAAASEGQGERAWAAAVVFVDAGLFQYGALSEMRTELASISSKRPVLIFLHGCDGLYDLKRGPKKVSNLFSSYYKMLTRANELGYIAVAPDSFATERNDNCPKKANRFGQHVHGLREAELAYAIEQVKAAPWADTSRIVLFGHSEGGRSVLRYSAMDVRGVLSTGWSCGSAQHNVVTNMPVLNIKAGNDPVDTNRERCYFHGPNQRFIDPLDGRHAPGDGTWGTYIEPFLRSLLK